MLIKYKCYCSELKTKKIMIILTTFNNDVKNYKNH